jgi:hypothetical protein
MKAGNFNINDYLNKLYENSNDGNPTNPGDAIIIPDENKKSYDWLKREYDKSKVEVKVEIKMGGSDFKPGYEMQTDLKSVKDFKPGMFGDVKTSDSPGSKKETKSEETPKVGGDQESPAEKKAETSTGGEKPKQKFSGKVKTAEESEEKPKKKEEDKDKEKE